MGDPKTRQQRSQSRKLRFLHKKKKEDIIVAHGKSKKRSREEQQDFRLRNAALLEDDGDYANVDDFLLKEIKVRTNE